jgi:hypothetical protein
MQWFRLEIMGYLLVCMNLKSFFGLIANTDKRWRIKWIGKHSREGFKRLWISIQFEENCWPSKWHASLWMEFLSDK